MKDRIFVHEGLKVLKSKTHGYGVYTMQPIRKGDIIEECVVPMDSISYSYLYLGTRSVQLNSETMQNYRFAYEYENPKDILKGLQQFKETYEFINKDELNPEPVRKQKRND